MPVDGRQFVPEQALNSIASVGIAAANIADRPLTVLDFGGGCGFHYFRVVPVVRTPLQWAIVETPTMADRAAKLARGRFQVFTNVAEAAKVLGRIDLLHASSALQYVRDPLATLKALVALRPRYFALTRFPLWGGVQVVGVQKSMLAGNGIGPMPPQIPDREVLYPVTFTNFDDVMRTLADYQVVMALGSPSSTYEVCGRHVQGISLIFCSKEAPRITQSVSETARSVSTS